MSVRIAYLVHDLSDSAVHRRVEMLTQGGALVHLAGFSRGPYSHEKEISCTHLGETKDAKLISRALKVGQTMLQARRLAMIVDSASVIIARNLEMLVLAEQARRKYAPDATLVYECLDIHRLLLSPSVPGRLVRAIETQAWKNVDLILTSSPAFIRNYFLPRGYKGKIETIENKLLLPGERSVRRHRNGPPWKIGFFGMLRCRKSLEMLAELAATMKGKVEVILRGKPSAAVFKNFQRLIEGLPSMTYLGPYFQANLANIYSDVHFCWAIDFYEEGFNSSWLLPNRIYESSFYGSVPLALKNVETGRWLAHHKAGVLLSEPFQNSLHNFFTGLENTSYEALANKVGQIPDGALRFDHDQCRALVQRIASVSLNTSSMATNAKPEMSMP